MSGRAGRWRMVRWGTAALLGVALAVALTLATLQLTDQHVGLAGEPPSAGSGLVPAATTRTTRTSRTTMTTRTTTTATTPTSTNAPSGDDDHGGGDRGGEEAEGDD